MDLHANAALSLNKRRLLAWRVIEERWTLTKAAAAAEVSVRCLTAPRASAARSAAVRVDVGDTGLLPFRESAASTNRSLGGRPT